MVGEVSDGASRGELADAESGAGTPSTDTSLRAPSADLRRSMTTSEHDYWAERSDPTTLFTRPAQAPLSELIGDAMLRAAAAGADEPGSGRARRNRQKLSSEDPFATSVRSGQRDPLLPEQAEPNLEVLSERLNSISKVGAELLQAGLRLGGPALASRMFQSAWQSFDWALLERAILQAPQDLLAGPPGHHDWARQMPRDERRAHPVLSVALAIAQSSDSVRHELDIAGATGILLREGRELHFDWRRRPEIDAKIVAGSLWMLSQTGVDSAIRDPSRNEAWATRIAIEEQVHGATRDGQTPATAALAFFHSISAIVAGLRMDWEEAGRNAELTMLLAPDCGILGFLAASLLACASFHTGTSSGRQRSEQFFADHEAHHCRSAQWLKPLRHLPQALAAIHRLDRDAVREHFAAAQNLQASRWFGHPLLLHSAKAYAGILWENPEQALAAFDASVSVHQMMDVANDATQLMVLRTRLDLLLNLGDLDNAGIIIEKLTHRWERSRILVPIARLHLCRREFDQAISAAEEGIHLTQLSLTERAALQVIRAAAGLLTKNTGAAADRAFTAACVICWEADTLMPLGLIPRDTLAELLDGHQRHEDGSGCYFGRELTAQRLAALRPGYPTVRPVVRLTPREETLLPLLATPAPLSEVSRQLFVSVNTVRKQVVTLREKLDAADRSELVARAIELGLLAGPSASQGSAQTPAGELAD